MRKFLFLLVAGACTTMSAQQTSITVTRVPQQGPSFFVRQPDAGLVSEFNAFKAKLSAYYPVTSKAENGEYVLVYIEHLSLYVQECQVVRAGSNDVPPAEVTETRYYGENYKVKQYFLPTSAERSRVYYYVRKTPDHRIDSLNAQLNRNSKQLSGVNGGTSLFHLKAENDSIHRIISPFIQPEIAEMSRQLKKETPVPFTDSLQNCRLMYFQETNVYTTASDKNQNPAGQIICERGDETVMAFSDWTKEMLIQRSGEITSWTNGEYIMVEARQRVTTDGRTWEKTRVYCFRKM